jgi:hypothetical protein
MAGIRGFATATFRRQGRDRWETNLDWSDALVEKARRASTGILAAILYVTRSLRSCVREYWGYR